jgi:hypothetical protein
MILDLTLELGFWLYDRQLGSYPVFYSQQNGSRPPLFFRNARSSLLELVA